MLNKPRDPTDSTIPGGMRSTLLRQGRAAGRSFHDIVFGILRVAPEKRPAGHRHSSPHPSQGSMCPTAVHVVPMA